MNPQQLKPESDEWRQEAERLAALLDSWERKAGATLQQCQASTRHLRKIMPGLVILGGGYRGLDDTALANFSAARQPNSKYIHRVRVLIEDIRACVSEAELGEGGESQRIEHTKASSHDFTDGDWSAPVFTVKELGKIFRCKPEFAKVEEMIGAGSIVKTSRQKCRVRYDRLPGAEKIVLKELEGDRG